MYPIFAVFLCNTICLSKKKKIFVQDIDKGDHTVAGDVDAHVLVVLVVLRLELLEVPGRNILLG